MSRRDSFDAGHGNENHKIRIDPEMANKLRGVADASKEQASWERDRAQTPVNLSDLTDLRVHLISAHGMHPDETAFYDESAHDSIPALANRQRNWSGNTVPELDHTDLFHLHDHEHTAGEYASDYPHTTMGSSHFHH